MPIPRSMLLSNFCQLSARLHKTSPGSAVCKSPRLHFTSMWDNRCIKTTNRSSTLCSEVVCSNHCLVETVTWHNSSCKTSLSPCLSSFPPLPLLRSYTMQSWIPLRNHLPRNLYKQSHPLNLKSRWVLVPLLRMKGGEPSGCSFNKGERLFERGLVW